MSRLKLPTLCLLFAVILIAPQLTGAQGSGYTKKQVTTDSADHEWPALNNSGDQVWCRKVGNRWQLYLNGAQMTSDDYDHMYPVIDDAKNIIYLKSPVGQGVQRSVVKRDPAGNESTIEFSSQNGSSHRDAGQHFGVASDGTIVWYYDWTLTGSFQGRRLHTSNLGQILDDIYPGDYFDINKNGVIVYSEGGSIYTTTATSPGTINFLVVGDYPRVADGTNPEIVYIAGGQVVSTVNGTVDGGTWADVNNAGSVIYSQNVNGFDQVFLAQPGPLQITITRNAKGSRERLLCDFRGLDYYGYVTTFTGLISYTKADGTSTNHPYWEAQDVVPAGTYNGTDERRFRPNGAEKSPGIHITDSPIPGAGYSSTWIHYGTGFDTGDGLVQVGATIEVNKPYTTGCFVFADIAELVKSPIPNPPRNYVITVVDNYPALQPTDYSISGTVVTASGPVAGAQVVAEQGNQIIAQGTTNTVGRYVIIGVLPSTYTVAPIVDGYLIKGKRRNPPLPWLPPSFVDSLTVTTDGNTAGYPCPPDCYGVDFLAQICSVASLALNPNPVHGGNPVTGTIALNCAAPLGGLSVMLTSSNSSIAAVPASITIPAGQLSCTFNVVTTHGAAVQSATIKATANAVNKSQKLKVIP